MKPTKLAFELGISDKSLRAFLRRRFPRHPGEKSHAWFMTEEQIAAARAQFGRGKHTVGPLLNDGAAALPEKIPHHALQTSDNLVEQRRHAAERFKPDHVRLLLVAETPPVSQPPDPPRYFYFEDVTKHDDLYRGVIKAILGIQPTRHSKASVLKRLREEGVFLIDLKTDPSDPRQYADCIPDLLNRCLHLNPDKIILIKANVYDVAFESLKTSGLPIVDVRMPFPGSGRQAEFAVSMFKALELAEWTHRSA